MFHIFIVNDFTNFRGKSSEEYREELSIFNYQPLTTNDCEENNQTQVNTEVDEVTPINTSLSTFTSEGSDQKRPNKKIKKKLMAVRNMEQQILNTPIKTWPIEDENGTEDNFIKISERDNKIHYTEMRNSTINSVRVNIFGNDKHEKMGIKQPNFDDIKRKKISLDFSQSLNDLRRSVIDKMSTDPCASTVNEKINRGQNCHSIDIHQNIDTKTRIEDLISSTGKNFSYFDCESYIYRK